MADTPISGLPAVAAAAGANEFPVNEVGTTKKVTITQLVSFLTLKGLFAEITASTTTTSASFVDLLTQVITIGAGSDLVVLFSASVNNTTLNTDVDFQITIDAVARRGSRVRITPAGVNQSTAIVFKALGLAAGARTVKIQWRTSGGTARVDPAANIFEHASLLVSEEK